VRQAVEVAELASEQWGLVTTAQAGLLGVSSQTMAALANDGVAERLAHGVYRMTGAPPGEHDDLRAAWLALDPTRTAAQRLRDPDAVVSFRSAANLHRLGDLDADRHDFTVEGRRQTRRINVRFHTRSHSPDDWRVFDGLPVTTIVKTIEDLASARTDGGHLAGIVRDAITTAGVDATQISEVLAPYAHKYGARLGDGEGLVARFIDEAGLPLATRQAAALAQLAKLDAPFDRNAAAVLSAEEFSRRFGEALLANPEFRRQAAAVHQSMLSAAPRLDLAPLLSESVTTAFASILEIVGPDPTLAHRPADGSPKRSRHSRPDRGAAE
jgi:predicted transcriptional regulator of viral defense system